MAKSKFGIEKGQPLVLPNGTKIDKDEEGGTVVQTKKEQEEKALLDEILADVFLDPNVETFQRTLADINVPKQEFNPVMLVLSYSMWGLDDHAIARFLEIDVSAVEHIKSTELYTRTRTEMLEAIRYAEQSTIHGYLTQKARQAAATVAASMSAKKEETRLAAANSVLDRAGFRPVDRVEHTMRFEDELRIVHIQKDKTPTIDVEI
jgi:hypothetical protein